MKGRLVRLLLTADQTSDHKGAAAGVPVLSAARELPGERGYDSARSRADLQERGIQPCILSTSGRKITIRTTRCSTGSIIASRTRSAALKIGVAPPHGTVAHTFFSANCIAATVIFRLPW